MSIHPEDGNLAAIERHLAEQEFWETLEDRAEKEDEDGEEKEGYE
jgi:hypothetical protein